MVLCVAGPLDARGRAQRAGRRSRASRPARARRPRAPRAAGRGPRFRAVHNESAQTQVHVLFHALPETDPGYPALRALMRVLDDGMSTRLHYQICDQKGLAYSVAGSLHSYHDAALLEIDAACSHAKLPALVTETLAMLGALPRRARSARTSSRRPSAASSATWSRRYDDLDGLCGWFGGTELYCPADPQEKRARALARVRPEEIREVARRVLRPERLSVTAVGSLSPSLSRRVEKLVTGFALSRGRAATCACGFFAPLGGFARRRRRA